MREALTRAVSGLGRRERGGWMVPIGMFYCIAVQALRGRIVAARR